MNSQQSLTRLAFVQQWSDELFAHVLRFYAARCQPIDDVPSLVQRAVDNLNLSALRDGGDPQLADLGAQGLGFDNAEALRNFESQHPILSAKWQALPVLEACQGTVVATSRTEVILDLGNGNYRSTGLGTDPVSIGDVVKVSRFGRLTRVEEAEQASYEAGRVGMPMPTSVAENKLLKHHFERGAADAARDAQSNDCANAVADAGFDPSAPGHSRGADEPPQATPKAAIKSKGPGMGM